jgi:DNA-binding NarL/FixJ family response regulator
MRQRGNCPVNAHDPIRVLLVDDQPVFLEALRLFLEHDGQVEVVATAVDGAEALELARRQSPQVVVMDLGLPGMDGLEATRRLLAARPDTAVIVLTGRSGAGLAADARSAGARAFLTKGGVAESEALLEQILALAPLNPPA